MIGTIVRVGWINLRRDRVAQAMTFVLPIAFFSIFALVFGQQSRQEMRPVRLAVVDEDGSEASGRLAKALAGEKALRVVTSAAPAGKSGPETVLDRARATALVRDGSVPAALVIPRGFGQAFGMATATGGEVELLADTSDPIAPQVVQGLLQKAAMTAAPDLLIGRGLEQFERYAGGLTPSQRQAMDRWLPSVKAGSGAAGGTGAVAAGLVPVRTVDVLGAARDNPLVSFYAAGIGVMFLLFSCSAASGSLLEESEAGTLERVLSTRLGMSRLLLGKWVYLILLGTVQVTVMFLWGALVFRLPLLRHLPGFAVMTVTTAAAAGAFGLLLATASRSRAQLSGLATIVILMMSAVGGSMFPRFLMSETMQRLGLLTFNGWALDGYIKVFWRDAPLGSLWPQLAVLAGLTAAFLSVARLLARRWETA